MTGPTIIDDAYQGEPIPGWEPKRVLEHLDEPIPPAGRPCLFEGRPCILYMDWDFAQDWSGEHVRELHPFTLLRAPELSVADFWSLVRKLHPQPVNK